MSCYFIIYNVQLGQSIGVLPNEHRDYAMMVDCGHDNDFHPISDFGRFLPQTEKEQSRPSLRALALTNYDHDHFSGLPVLRQSAQIQSVFFPKNLEMSEIRGLKKQSSEALDSLEEMRRTFTGSGESYSPPFNRHIVSLTKIELAYADIPVTTNHLSQMVFLEYGQTTLCIPGDLEGRSWDLMLAKSDVQNWLRKTDILMAPHHGRWNGYHEGIFDYCQPACIILSDKPIVHETQQDMAKLYAKHVRWDGISYTSTAGQTSPRKTLTTRSDGHILVTVPLIGEPTFQTYVL